MVRRSTPTLDRTIEVMESGSVLGIISSMAMLAWCGVAVVLCFRSRDMSLLRQVALLAAGPLLAWAGTYLIWRFFGVSDSSHGIATLAVPALVAVALVLLSVLALVVSRFRAGRGRRRNAV